MKQQHVRRLGLAVILGIVTVTAAAVTAQQAAKIGGELTPMGA
jgi:hypothetical protein